MELKYRIVPREGDLAWLRVECPNGVQRPGATTRECQFSLWRRPAEGVMWQWDGNTEKPTISPSVNCHGGCGRHFTMIQGEPK
jgi:hypothetical protein